MSFNGSFSCAVSEGYSTVRFVLLSISSTISFLGIFANLFLAWIFGRIASNSTQSVLYLAILAILDSALCTCYLLLFGIDSVVYYLRIRFLFDFMFTYIIPVFIISRTVQLALPFLLIFAQFEKWLLIGDGKKRVASRMATCRCRRIICILVLTISVCCRIPMAWSLTLDYYPNCTDYFRSKSLSVTGIFFERAFQIYDVYVVTGIQIFAPFFGLLFLNIATIRKLLATPKFQNYRHSLRYDTDVGLKEVAISTRGPEVALMYFNNRRQLATIRNAITTMVVIVSTHLTCSGLHVLLTLVERLQSHLLYSDDMENFAKLFVHLSDLVSFLYMLSSAGRLGIYAICNVQVRTEIETLCTSKSEEIVTKMLEKDSNNVPLDNCNNANGVQIASKEYVCYVYDI